MYYLTPLCCLNPKDLLAWVYNCSYGWLLLCAVLFFCTEMLRKIIGRKLCIGLTGQQEQKDWACQASVPCLSLFRKEQPLMLYLSSLFIIPAWSSPLFSEYQFVAVAAELLLLFRKEISKPLVIIWKENMNMKEIRGEGGQGDGKVRWEPSVCQVYINKVVKW